MSSLTAELRDSASPVTIWLRETFPNHKQIQADYRTRAGTAVQLPQPGIAAGTQGAAIDWWIRLLLDPEPSPHLATYACLRAGPVPWARAGVQMLVGLGAAGPDSLFDLHPIDPTVWQNRTDQWVARACFSLALLLEPFRAPGIADRSRLAQLVGDCGPRELMGLATEDEVADLIAMRDLARDHLIPAVAGHPVESGPTFNGSEDLPADADLIVGRQLLDIKASQGGSPRRDGTRAASLGRVELDQLLGYALLDYSDTYELDSVGHYLARYGTTITWPLVDLCAELAGHPVDLADLRVEFRRLLREDLPDYWERIGAQAAPPPELEPGVADIVLTLPSKPKRRGRL